MSGKSGTGEVGNTVTYRIDDRNSAHSATGTLSVGADGSFGTNVDLSSFDDGMLTYSAFVTDALGNV